MWRDEEFFEEDFEECRGRRNQRDFECECRDERGLRDLEDVRGIREFGCNSRSCVCRQLRRLNRLERVTLFLRSSSRIERVLFVGFENEGCCANFVRNERDREDFFIVDCRDIEAIEIRSRRCD